MNGYKGKVAFFKEIGCLCNTIYPFHGEMIDYAKNKDKFIFLGECDVDVTFQDDRQPEIEVLQKQIENVRAESQHKINIMLGKIQELQALESA